MSDNRTDCIKKINEIIIELSALNFGIDHLLNYLAAICPECRDPIMVIIQEHKKKNYGTVKQLLIDLKGILNRDPFDYGEAGGGSEIYK